MNRREDLSKIPRQELEQRLKDCIERMFAFDKEYPNDLWREDPEGEGERDDLVGAYNRLTQVLNDYQSPNNQSTKNSEPDELSLPLKKSKTKQTGKIRKKRKKPKILKEILPPKMVTLNVPFNPPERPDKLTMMKAMFVELSIQRNYHEGQVGKLTTEITRLKHDMVPVSMETFIKKESELDL